MIFVWLLSVCMKWYQGRVKAPPHLCPRLPLFPPVPPHPRIKSGAGSSPLPLGGEGMALAGASPASGRFANRPYVASPSFRKGRATTRARGDGSGRGMFYDTNVVSNFDDLTGFVTYIDESGDEGFVFNPDGSGSSRWFVLSAVVTRRINDLQMVDCLREARKVLGKAPKTPLHFADLRHEQRVPYIRRVGNLDIRTVNVAVYKPSIRERATFQGNKNLLYRYTTRFLVERLSWLLSRTSTGTPGQNRFTEVIFSDRANMSYEDIRDYLRRLVRQSDADPSRVQLDGSIIDP